MKDAPRLAPLLAAKTTPPTPRGAILRHDQLSRLIEASRARLLLVQAPAGYGKTTLVAAAAAELGWPYVWYRLDELDSEPSSFLPAFAHTVRMRLPVPVPGGALRVKTRHPADDASASVELAAHFVQEVAQKSDEELHLVLDDYDSLKTTERFDRMVEALLRLLPPNLHLVVLSRRQPGFTTAKLGLEGQRAEITPSDLRLDDAQVAAVFERQCGTAPHPAAIANLIGLTEGWAAGVVLAAQSMSSGGHATLDGTVEGRGFERALFAYLDSEVYCRQPAEVQRLLRDTSCLEPLTAELAEAVSGSQQARRLLEYLQEGGVFTFADASEDALRYHPLFRRLLQAKAMRERGSEAYRTLQRESADALADQGHTAAALDLYLVLDEEQRTVSLLENGGVELFGECSGQLLHRWVDALQTAMPDSPSAALVAGVRELRRGEYSPAEQLLKEAASTPQVSQACRYLALRHLGDCRYLVGDDYEAVIHLKAALAGVPSEREKASTLAALCVVLSGACRWSELAETLADFSSCADIPDALKHKISAVEAQSLLMTGDVAGALSVAEAAFPAFQSGASPATAIGLTILLANINCYAGHYSRSEQMLAKARETSEAEGVITEVRGALLLTQGLLAAQRGRLWEALAELDQAARETPSQSDSVLLAEILSRRGTTLRRAGELGAASESYQRALDTITPSGGAYEQLDIRLDLAFTDCLRGLGTTATIDQISRLGSEAAEASLRHQSARAGFFLGVLSILDAGKADVEWYTACDDLLRLGQVDFIGQELAACPEAARAFVTSGQVEEASVASALRAIAPQVGAVDVLASLSTISERMGTLVVDASRRGLSVDQRLQLLRTLRHHPSKRVRDLAKRILPIKTAAEGSLFPELTGREEGILALLAAGSTNQEIAEDLALTLSTVKTHVHRILHKTQTRGRLAAAVLYQDRLAERVWSAAAPPLEAAELSGAWR